MVTTDACAETWFSVALESTDSTSRLIPVRDRLNEAISRIHECGRHGDTARKGEVIVSLKPTRSIHNWMGNLTARASFGGVMEANKFWFVWNSQGRAPTFKHSSYQSAKDEAERLANLNPNQSFVVLESMVECRKSTVLWIEHRELDSGIPF